jgi:Na+-translocating ferredoxin:NAD+ oxidoreductase RnfD subunit
MVAIVLDSVIIKFRSKRWYFPGGAIISAMIIALIINPTQIFITIYVVVISLILKHLFRLNFRNIFNPAALGIVVSSLFFPVSSAWWGSTGIIAFILGLILVIVIKRLNIALSFFLTFSLISYGYGFFVDNSYVTQGFFSGPIVFFAFFMMIEPVTIPATNRSRIIFGILTALLVFILSLSNYLFANSFFIYIGLLIMNLVTRIMPRRLMR